MFAARITLISIAFCGLMIVAVFTERRSVEAVLRTNEERFARLAASAPGMICSFRIDKDGRKSMPYASPAIGPILSLSVEDVRADAEAFFQQCPRLLNGATNRRVRHGQRASGGQLEQAGG